MVDAAGDIFVADALNHRIRKIDVGPDTISTYGGTGTIGYSGDGGPATSAAVNTPRGVFVDASGDLFLADTKLLEMHEEKVFGVDSEFDFKLVEFILNNRDGK